MVFKTLLLAIVVIGWFSIPAICQSPSSEPTFSTEDMSGSKIFSDVRSSFQDESLFVIRSDTGMSPGVPESSIRYPPVNIIAMRPYPIAGSWSLTLTDIVTKYMNLNLYQSEDSVFGNGGLIDGGMTTQLTAGGTIVGDRLALYVIPVGTQNLYRMSLTLRPGSMDGSYILSSPGVTQPGVAFGNLVSPQQALYQQNPQAFQSAQQVIGQPNPQTYQSAQ
jgi:hypothetical protein